jgi:autotransporter-associated beta strand protein
LPHCGPAGNRSDCRRSRVATARSGARGRRYLARSPGSGDFDGGANWNPAALNGHSPTGTAFFGASSVTSLSFSSIGTFIGGWTFNAGASAYTFTNGQVLQFTGAGIVINGGSASITNNSVLNFLGTSTAGSASITNSFDLNFNNTSTAGSASITNDRVLTFLGTSTAGSATITSFGNTFIEGSASGGTARFILNRTGPLDISQLATGGTTAGSIEGAGSVFLGSNNLAVGGNNLSTTFSGVIQDGGLVGGAGGSLTKTGTGTLTLSGTNTYTGGTTVEAGTLAISADHNLGANTGGITFNGGTLQFGASFDLANTRAITLNAGGGTFDTNGFNTTLSQAIAGTGGALTKTGSGTLTLSGANTYTGGTTVEAGTLRAGGAGAFVGNTAYAVNGGTLDLNGFNLTMSSLSGTGGTVALGAAALAIDQATDTSYAGAVTGTGSLTKAGAGTLTLSGANTYTGATTVDAGTLQLGSGGTSGSIVGDVADRGVLAFNRADAVTFDGMISGTGAVNQLGPGTTTLSGANTYTGGTTISAGTLQLGNGGTSGSIVGDVADRGVLAFNRSDAVTFGGVISGTGAVNQTGSGTTTLTGANTYTGATNVGAGLLQAGAANTFAPSSAFAVAGGATLDLNNFNQIIGSLAGTGGVTFGSASLTAGGDNTSTIYSGIMSGTGGFTKTGSGKLILSGINTYTGATVIDGGTLSVNGDITASNGVTVNAGGTLGGNGIVGDTAINGGALAPGNSISTLTVSGSLTLTAASTYLVQMSGTSSDKTMVAGTANLGGKVTVDPLARIAATTTYTILTAGTVSETFATAGFLTANSFARNARLSYVGNTVLLTLDPGLLSPNLSGTANINQRNVAAGIDNALVGGSTMPAGFNALFALSGDGLLNALTQASGETATGTQQTTFDAMTQFMGVMTDPFVAGRGEGVSSSSGAPQFADENDNASAYADNGKPRTKSERDAYAAIYRKAPVMVDPFAQRWSVWAAGYGGSQTTAGNATMGSNSATSRIAGTAVGADYRFSPFTLAGFALAGGGTNFSVNGSGSGRSDLFQAGAFIRHTVGPAYISGALAYGWQDITTDRTVTVAGADQLRADFNANAWSGRVEGGYRFVTPWVGGVGLTPYAAGQFTTFDLPAYAEGVLSGANTFALSYAARSVTDTRSELGLRTDKSFAMQDAILTLRGRFAWAHDYNPDRSIGATFQTLPGASFVVNGAAQASDSALTTASAELKWRNGWSAAATFEGEFSEVTESYAGKGVVRYAW